MLRESKLDIEVPYCCVVAVVERADFGGVWVGVLGANQCDSLSVGVCCLAWRVVEGVRVFKPRPPWHGDGNEVLALRAEENEVLRGFGEVSEAGVPLASLECASRVVALAWGESDIVLSDVFDVDLERGVVWDSVGVVLVHEDDSEG